MTTIAYDGINVACDSLMTSDGHTIPGDRAKKVFVLPDGSLFCGAGYYDEVLLVHDWLLRGKKDPPVLKNFDGLLVSTKGCEYFCETLRPHVCMGRYIAIGSGSRYANTAMELGKTARQAVAIAMKFDRSTGGQIYEYTPTKITKRRKRTVN